MNKSMTSEVMSFTFGRCYNHFLMHHNDSRLAAAQMPPTPVGELLREWRAARRLSQLDLALEAGMSARHLSCIETGRAQPSREMLVRIAQTLDMPLRERNALFMAAGYAPEYPETPLGTRDLAPIQRAIAFILDHQEPYPAFVLNRHWDVLMANQAAARIGNFLCGGSKHTNMIRRFFDPIDLRAVVANWEEVASDLIRHLQDSVAIAPTDAKGRALLDEVLRYPNVPSQWRRRKLSTAPSPLLTVAFRKDDHELSFFSTITTFGTSRDITIEELRIECNFPADEVTAEICRALATDDNHAGNQPNN